jgi:ABC-type oligopeptide transport system substrate-binding subunit
MPGRRSLSLISRATLLLLLLGNGAFLAAQQPPAGENPKKSQILYVGVHELPELLSPASAWTDSERQAVELLFEGLIEPRYDTRWGQFYRPQLALTLPEIVPGGRRFRLARGARWSDGTPVTSLDVRHSAQLLKASARAPEWLDLLEEPRVEDDPYRLDVQFRQLPLDPLARLAFKVLPQTFRGKGLFRADDPEFARQPLGSGPFCYAGRQTHDGRDCAVFTANPIYHRPGLPQLRAIRFFVSQDPAADFRNADHPMQLLLNLPTDRLATVSDVREIHTLKSRRITFLAVNHRVPALQNQDLRQALGHAIDRERILNECFRGGLVEEQKKKRALHPEFHQALTGVFPAGSWASGEAFRPRPDLAKLHARKSGVKNLELTLAYPDNGPSVAGACRLIAEQIAALDPEVGLRLKLLPLPPRQLKEAVDQRRYELAYLHQDYADESYWLWPLFDTRPEALQPGGSNFLGYKNDDVLEKLFRDIMSEREFVKVKERTHALGAHLFEHMPLIPLWQLDVHLAIHPDLNLQLSRLDPLRVFADVEEWTLVDKNK